MKSIEQFASLLSYSNIDVWRNRVFQLGNELGYGHTMLAIIPSRSSSTEAGAAFLQSNYSSKWRSKYDEEKMAYVDPTVSHCATKCIPLVWTPDIFAAPKQKEMYEEASGHGLRSGVTLPIHGANGELGMLCFASDIKPDHKFSIDIIHNIPELACLRDFISETSLQFRYASNRENQPIPLTPRELECLKWSVTGKSSWDIGQILNCSEAVVNFHFKNIRSKFGTSTRRQALVKAISLGIISPS